MSISISTALLARLQEEAAAAAEIETCGLLFGTAGRIAAAQPCRNVAAETRISFEIDPAALLAAHRAMRAGGPQLIGCYHSHPRGPATPSPRDAASAGEPGFLWLILGQGGGAHGLFVAERGGPIHDRFREVPIVAVAGEPGATR